MMFLIYVLYSKLNIISFNGQKKILFRFLHRKKTAFSIFFLQQINKFYFSGRFVQLKQTCINLYRLFPCFCFKVYEWIKNQSNKAVFSRETLVHVHVWDSGKLTRLSPFSLCTVIWMITSHIDKTIWNSLIVLCHFFRESNARSQVRSTFL